MEKMYASALAITAIVCLAFAHAHEREFSDFDGAGYPRHQCRQPAPPSGKDPLDNRFFKQNLEQYRLCIREYARAARNERGPAGQRANEAVEEFNAFVRELNEGV